MRLMGSCGRTIDGKVINIAGYPAALTTLWLGLLNNDSSLETTGEEDLQKTYRIVGDPTEGALLVAAAKAGAAHVVATMSELGARLAVGAA